MKYLIAIDSDGTLRHSDGNISDKTKKIIKKVVDCGNIVVICTARPRYYTLKISNEVGLNEYLISSNGTEIYDNVNKKNIYSTYLPKEECKIIYQETKKLGLRVMFVAENTEYVTMFTRNDSQILLDDNNAYILLKKEIKQKLHKITIWVLSMKYLKMYRRNFLWTDIPKLSPKGLKDILKNISYYLKPFRRI